MGTLRPSCGVDAYFACIDQYFVLFCAQARSNFTHLAKKRQHPFN